MKDKIYRLTEIFYSIQTEGKFSGHPAIFIRFSGCNKSCWFCDTDFSNKLNLSVDEIYDRIIDYETDLIIITGGEPYLQVDNDFINYFQNKGYKLNVETNGSIEKDLDFNWITCSPKLGGIKLKECDELKIVYDKDLIEKDYDIVYKYLYIQPLWDGDECNVLETIDYIKKFGGILSYQLQKIIDIE